MPTDSPYNEDGTIDWTYFDRPAVAGQVYVANPDTNEYSRDTISLQEAEDRYSYGTLSDYEKRNIYNDPGDLMMFSPNMPSGNSQPLLGSTQGTVDIRETTESQDNTTTENLSDGKLTTQVGFFDGISPFDDEPWRPFGQPLPWEGISPFDDTPWALNPLSNPILILVLFMLMNGKKGSGLSSLLPLILLFMPNLFGGTNSTNITGGEMV